MKYKVNYQRLMPKPKKVKIDIPLEREEDRTFADWLDIMGLKFSHISNEANSMQAVMRNKRIGVRAGVPDFLVITSKGLLFIEMKRLKGGSVSEAQSGWITALNECKGVQATIAKGADEAIQFVTKYL